MCLRPARLLPRVGKVRVYVDFEGRVESINIIVMRFLLSAVGEAQAKSGGPPPQQTERKVSRALHGLGKGRRRG